jgi:hypothetical protein
VSPDILIRDGHRCVRCGTLVSQAWPGYSCHHRKLGDRSDNRPENLITLCGSGSSPHCHFYVHNHPREARDHGWIVSKYNDPAQVPVDIYGRGLVLLTAELGFAEWNAA